MRHLAIWAALALAGCHSSGVGAGAPGDAEDTRPFHEIAPADVLHFAGTEPFWGGTVTGSTLTWSTPENAGGEAIMVTRFAGRGGLTFSGTLDGAALDMAFTPAQCSDGMSDRTYPFAVTVSLGAQQLDGCGWREGDDLGPTP